MDLTKNIEETLKDYYYITRKTGFVEHFHYPKSNEDYIEITELEYEDLLEIEQKQEEERLERAYLIEAEKRWK